MGGGGCRDTNLDEPMSEFKFYMLCIDFTGVIIQFFTKICRPPNSAALGYSPFSPYVNPGLKAYILLTPNVSQIYLIRDYRTIFIC